MSASIRDLMRREKAARRQTAIEEEQNKLKKRVVHFADYVSDDTTPVATTLVVNRAEDTDSPRVLEETFELISDSEDTSKEDIAVQYRRHTQHEAGLGSGRLTQTEKAPLATKKIDIPKDITSKSSLVDWHSIINEGRSKSDSNAHQSVEKGAHMSDEDALTSRQDVNTNEENSVDLYRWGEPKVNLEVLKHEQNNKTGTDVTVERDSDDYPVFPVSHVDDDIRIYDQLNTAFCSSIDYEREQIMGNFQRDEVIEESSEPNSKVTITSDNFGKSNMRLSKDENLPEGFFDNRRADAEARGKLSVKEASEKIKTLNKTKSELLTEASYLQEKFFESYRERVRLQNDSQEHEEVMKELRTKVESIRNDLTAEVPTADVEMENKVEITDSMQSNLDALYDYEDFEDISWRKKSVM